MPPLPCRIREFSRQAMERRHPRLRQDQCGFPRHLQKQQRGSPPRHAFNRRAIGIDRHRPYWKSALGAQARTESFLASVTSRMSRLAWSARSVAVKGECSGCPWVRQEGSHRRSRGIRTDFKMDGQQRIGVIEEVDIYRPMMVRYSWHIGVTR